MAGEWSFERRGGIVGQWPKDENGELVAPVFLEHVSGEPMTVDMERTMLAAFGIATVIQCPNDGEWGQVVMGYAGGGVDIYVPETLIEDARDILSGDVEPVEEEDV